MRVMSGQRGFTLIEMLVALSITMVLMGAMSLLLTEFLNDNSHETTRNQAQENAQVMIDRISRELRSAKSPVTGSAGLLAEASSYDVAFQATVQGTPPSGNPSNQYWVRYCLDSNDTLWRQSTSTSSSASTSNTPPDTSACPSTSSSWVQSSGSPCCVELNDVTNEIGGDTTRPLFTFGPGDITSTSQLSAAQLATINSVEVTLYVDKQPGGQPGPTYLTTGAYFRNELSDPVPEFTPFFIADQGKTDVLLDGTASYDPQGQVLTYQWYSAGA